jgi:hypothetical protein
VRAPGVSRLTAIVLLALILVISAPSAAMADCGSVSYQSGGQDSGCGRASILGSLVVGATAITVVVALSVLNLYRGRTPPDEPAWSYRPRETVMIPDTPASSTPPEFLADTLATVAFRRRAGEWDLLLSSGADISPAHVLGSFTEAFEGWTSLSSIVVPAANGDRTWDQVRPATQWISELSAHGDGFEATVNLDLQWQDAAGRSGTARFPDSAELYFDPADRTVTLTIWPNFFSDEIYVYRRDPAGPFERRPLPFQSAASMNRARLQNSLHRWVAGTGGQIESWQSELLRGIQPGGFAADCAPY